LPVNVNGQAFAPGTDLAQEEVIKLIGTQSGNIDRKIAVELAGIHRCSGKQRPKLVKTGLEILAVDEEPPRDVRLVGLARQRNAIVDGKLMKVGQDGDRQARRITVAPSLERSISASIHVDAGFFCLYEQLALSRQTQLIVGPFGQLLLTHLDSGFFDDLSQPKWLPGSVVNIPTEGL
jgi:hypothetical protein